MYNAILYILINDRIKLYIIADKENYIYKIPNINEMSDRNYFNLSFLKSFQNLFNVSYKSIIDATDCMS